MAKIVKHECKQCGENGTGKFCNNCGQAYTTKRITLSTIVHEIFHFFSHLDKGFLYTLKKLIIAPGEAQKEYVEGHRAKHQKPFSMFFLCLTIAALVYYWVNLTLVNYFDSGDQGEVSFFHQGWAIVNIVMAPIYALITYAFFSKWVYNYAEIFILILYSLSLVVLGTGLLQLLKFFSPDFETRVLEAPLVVAYNLITNLKFFSGEKKSMIVLKTILSSALCFYLAAIVHNHVLDFFF